MVISRFSGSIFGFTSLLALVCAPDVHAQDGAIRGQVRDKDFDGPLPGVEVTLDGRVQVTTTDQGNYLLPNLAPGTYQLVFAKPGYVKQVRTGVAVVAGKLTDVDVSLANDFTEMPEFVVDDVSQVAPGSEAALLKLRFESPAFMDSVSSDLMSRAGASDAASALRLVSGATVKDGKSAVIRGLPDRYVSPQLNGVRLPSTDEDKRAVELDQFPATVIESIQVTKTFTPDQQGDASGGAVDLRLKRIPDETVLQFKSQIGYNSLAGNRDDFLSYRGGGVSFLGRDDGRRKVQSENLAQMRSWSGAVGVDEENSPVDYKWSAALGHKQDLGDGVRFGGYATFFYERDSSFVENGRDDSWWVENPGERLTPRFSQGAPPQGEFQTNFFDITRGVQSVQWGGLGTLGLETEHHQVNLSYLYTRTTEDSATLAEDTRGKEYYFPGHDPNDPNTPGHKEELAAPYLRLETLEYTERVTSSLQLAGRHEFETGASSLVRSPELTWTLSSNSANAYQPDRRDFGTRWFPERRVGSFVLPARHGTRKPAANTNLGNLQRTWREIDEQSLQYNVGFKVPLAGWEKEDLYFKVGVFGDTLDRSFQQDAFANAGDESFYFAPYETFWSRNFPNEQHPLTRSEFDVSYDGEQDIRAWYAMASIPIVSWLTFVGGARVESTDVSVKHDADPQALYYPIFANPPLPTVFGPEADVDFSQTDVLPAASFDIRPLDELTFRVAYSETIARPTFKEFSPTIQQPFLGGPIFIGNPRLGMSNVRNYDIRADYVPYEGGLISVSWFRKDVKDAIEYIQREIDFTFTSATNYPKGTLSGFEIEVRQSMGEFMEELTGLAIGGNATFIDSEVEISDIERQALSQPGVEIPIKRRDMSNAPEFLYNFYLTYELEETGTQFGLFYTLTGDTLLVGDSVVRGNYVPAIYAKEYETLNLSIAQRIGDHLRLQFQAKNLTDPVIETAFRSKFTGGDVRQSSLRRGIDFSIALTAEFRF